jgi:RND superfamily putative drug exporter
MQKAFPQSGGMSEAVTVFERPGGRLTKGDLQALERVAKAIRQPNPPEVTAEDLAEVTVRSPGSLALPSAGPFRNPLVSEHTHKGQAALVVVSMPASFISPSTEQIVGHVYSTVARHNKELGGLKVAVTGSGAFGYDYVAAARVSHERTTYVTLTAVIVILLLVFRAPGAAMVPLGAISIAAVVATKLLAIGQHFGMHAGTGERIFMFVLLYGAGIDYSLLFISRYREFLDVGTSDSAAASQGLNATMPAILASATTDTAGLLMLCFARHGAFRTTGPVVALALVVALMAAVTLVPALVSVAGARMFWPSRRMGQIGRRRFWPATSRLVSLRPALVLVVATAVLAVPAVRGASLRWVYDTLAALRGDYESKRGTAMAKRHWPVGAIAPVTVLVKADRELSTEDWKRISRAATGAAESLEGISNVRSLVQPLGGQQDRPIADKAERPPPAGPAGAVIRRMIEQRALDEYVSADKRAGRLVAWLDSEPLTLEAMDIVSRMRKAVNDGLTDTEAKFEVHISGATAAMMDVRSVTQRDFYLVGGLALGVIFVVVVALLRDVVLSAFVVAGTVLSYLATLGISYWVFTGLLGAAGLDWKVEVFLFVLMVAVGVDYSIFLAARIFQEAKERPLREATELAVAHTGPVISSCGVIMAATLGSLMVGDLALLEQLGFALALGMLVDTFVVRPLLLPAFIVLARRGGRPAT